MKIMISQGQRGLHNLLTNIVPFIGAVAVFIFFQIVSGGRMLTGRNLSAIFNEAFTLAIGAAGAVFIMSQGEINLSLGGIVGCAGAVGAKAGILSPWLVLPTAVLVGTFVGLLSGILVAKVKIQSFITTIALGFMCEGLVIFILDAGAQGAPREIYFADELTAKIPFLILYLVIFFLLFTFTGFGKSCKAIGAKEEVARQAGVSIDKIRILGFILSGLACGFAAFFSLARSGTASTSTGHNFHFEVLLALMLGGLPITGGWNTKFRSVVIGAILMAIINDGLIVWGLDAFVQQIIQGIIFIVAVAISFDRKNISIIE